MRINEITRMSAEVFKEVRKQKQLSVEELSDKLNIPIDIINGLENGLIIPSIRMMKLWQNTFMDIDFSNYCGEIGTKVMPMRKKKLVRTLEMRAEKEKRRAYRKELREVRKTIKQLKQPMQRFHINFLNYPNPNIQIAFVTNNKLVYGSFKYHGDDKDDLNWYIETDNKWVKNKTVTHWEYLYKVTQDVLKFLNLNQ